MIFACAELTARNARNNAAQGSPGTVTAAESRPDLADLTSRALPVSREIAKIIDTLSDTERIKGSAWRNSLNCLGQARRFFSRDSAGRPSRENPRPTSRQADIISESDFARVKRAHGYAADYAPAVSAVHSFFLLKRPANCY